MKRIKYLPNITTYRALWPLICSCIVLASSSCTKDYERINTPRNTIATIGPSQLPFLFAKAQTVTIPTAGYYQSAQNQYADQYAQYFANTATYFPSDRLVIPPADMNAVFDPIYTEFVPQLKTIFESSDPSSSEYALASILWVVGFHRVTDYFGPIPYSQAGQPNSFVPYDAQDKIYDDFFKRLDESIVILKGKTDEHPYGVFDMMYGGDVPKWIKFANTLRLRLALRISKVDPARAKAEGEKAFASGVMTDSPGDDAYIQRSGIGDDVNGLSLMSDWDEFRMSAAMESVLKGYSDPRMPIYFLPAQKTGTYEGLRNGLTATQLTDDANKNDANSHVGPKWASAAYGGGTDYLITPQIVISSSEAYFLRAEASLLGWDMGGSAKVLYEAGISASLKQWGITDDAVIQNYINGVGAPIAPGDYLNSPAVSDIPVKFDAGDEDIQLKQIILQKWLALFPDGAEAWADFRRSRALGFYPVANSDNPDLTNTSLQWIRRIPFLLSESQNNQAGVEGAGALLGGPDKITTPLWWDKN